MFARFFQRQQKDKWFWWAIGVLVGFAAIGAVWMLLTAIMQPAAY